jgi:hypothetical protein
MIAFLALGCVFGAIVYYLGTGADWHWGAALAAALVPVAFTYFMGVLGLLISAAFVAAIYKATT